MHQIQAGHRARAARLFGTGTPCAPWFEVLSLCYFGLAFSLFISAGFTGIGFLPEPTVLLPGSAVLSRFTSAGFTGTGFPPVEETPGALLGSWRR